jgi:hypothetical protein
MCFQVVKGVNVIARPLARNASALAAAVQVPQNVR